MNASNITAMFSSSFLSLLLSIGVFIFFFIWMKLMTKNNDHRHIVKGSRMGQLKNFTQENAITSRIEDYVSNGMKYEKRRKLEKLLFQSGLKLSVKDYFILNFASAIVLFLVATLVLNNVIAGFAMIIVGFVLPKQVITSIKNKRVAKLDSQIGAFIRMSVKRYNVTNKYPEAVAMTLEDFGGQEPITSEIKKTLSDIDLGMPVVDALEEMGRRTSNKYMKIFAGKFRAAQNIGTQEMREKLLDSVIESFEKEIKLKSRLNREIKSPVMEGFLMMTIVPACYIMQASFDSTYTETMTKDPLGQIAMAAVILLLLTSAWMLINKVGAPLENDDEE